LNVDGRLVVRATRVGGDTRLAGVARLVAAAQAEKAPVQRLADRISAIFVPAVIGVSLLVLVGWILATGDVQHAFTAAVAVLIIACPCALGLATPIALLVGSGRGAQLGIIIRGPSVLEDTRRVTTIVMDKTGTVTTGRMTVVDVVADGAAPGEVLAKAAAVESASEHPVARAIVEHATAGAPAGAVTDFVSVRGQGASGVVDGDRVYVGRPTFVQSWVGADLPSGVRDQVAMLGATGASLVAVGWDGRVRGLIAVTDTVRPTSRDAVTRLRGLGLEPILLTGDHAGAAASVARAIGVDRVISDVAPEDKVQQVQDLMARGEVVAMVGDGVNDAAALARADLGIAMGSGSDVAIEASDLTLSRADLLGAVDAIALSRKTLAIIKGNLFWAFAYNVAMIPLAAAGLLNPMLAGAAMAASSAFVVANSLRLRRFHPTT
jgi:Cu+-exporting ATPase